jgi:hypothetical protein
MNPTKSIHFQRLAHLFGQLQGQGGEVGVEIAGQDGAQDTYV